MGEELGEFNLRYADRKSSMSGILCKRDRHNHRVVLRDDNGDEFFVSEAAFRNYWRKVNTEEEREVIDVSEAVEVTEPVKASADVSVEKKNLSRTKKSKKGVAMYEVVITEQDKKNICKMLAWREANIPGSKNTILKSLVALIGE